MAASGNLMPHRSHDPEHDADDEQDQTNRPQRRHVHYEAENGHDDSEHDHRITPVVSPSTYPALRVQQTRLRIVTKRLA